MGAHDLFIAEIKAAAKCLHVLAGAEAALKAYALTALLPSGVTVTFTMDMKEDTCCVTITNAAGVTETKKVDIKKEQTHFMDSFKDWAIAAIAKLTTNGAIS